jgi:hypothetical protein
MLSQSPLDPQIDHCHHHQATRHYGRTGARRACPVVGLPDRTRQPRHSPPRSDGALRHRSVQQATSYLNNARGEAAGQSAYCSLQTGATSMIPDDQTSGRSLICWNIITSRHLRSVVMPMLIAWPYFDASTPLEWPAVSASAGGLALRCNLSPRSSSEYPRMDASASPAPNAPPRIVDEEA